MGVRIPLPLFYGKKKTAAIKTTVRNSRGRGIRTPMNGFGDRDTAIV